jgi:ubiquinone/menaquinone biosynthesis C-methylase UbiE
MTRGQSGQTPETWRPFEQVAHAYETWYDTPRGQRADQAERVLLEWLVGQGPGAQTLLEVGCGTGHFAAWLERRHHRVVGLDRAPAMLAELHRRHPELPVVLGDGHALPFRDGAVDVTVFVTTLEFLEQPVVALREAVRVSRRGLAILALNRWSLGGLSRRWGPGRRGTIRSHAHDLTIRSLRDLVRTAAGRRLTGLRWASTLFPDGLWAWRSRAPLGDIIGIGARLATPDPHTTA